jgi:F0F1-type ATP synthase beta subunit
VEIKLEKPRQQQQRQQLSPIPSINFKTAFEELCNKHELLNCGIEKIDLLLKLIRRDRLAVIGNRKYTQTLITRLCVNALLIPLTLSKKRIADFFVLPM